MKEKSLKIQKNAFFLLKNLVISKKSSNFAPAFERESMRDVVQPG